MLIPSAAETAAMAQAHQGSLRDSGSEVDATEAEANSVPVNEIKLGQFDVSAYQPVSNKTLRMHLDLVGLVLVDDESDALLALERTEHRFREQVIVTVRVSRWPI